MSQQVAGRLERNTAEVEALAARDDRRRHFVRFGRRQHEDRVRRRLFESLEERVPGGSRELVGLVDDVHLVATFTGPIGDLIAQIAHVVDAPIRGGVDLDEVQCAVVQRRAAQQAFIARIAVQGELVAVDRAVQNARDTGLAGPARSGEQIGV